MSPMDQNKEKQALNWTRAMDDYLVDAFMEQYKRGNKVKGTFTPKAYENIVKEMSVLLDVDIDKEKIKNRWKTLKKNFGEAFDIFKGGMSGFAWNPSTQLWEAEDEVWNQLIESKPIAATLRYKPFPNYDKMIPLYGVDRAGLGETSTIGDMRKNTEDVFTDVADDITPDSTQHGVQSQQNGQANEKLDANIQYDDSHGASSGTSRKKQKKTSTKESDSDIVCIKDIINEFTAALRDGNEAIRETIRAPRMTGAEVWNTIKECGFSQLDTTKLYRVLMRDVDQLAAFVECPSEARADFLNEMMNDF